MKKVNKLKQNQNSNNKPRKQRVMIFTFLFSLIALFFLSLVDFTQLPFYCLVKIFEQLLFKKYKLQGYVCYYLIKTKNKSAIRDKRMEKKNHKSCSNDMQGVFIPQLTAEKYTNF